MPRLGHKFPTDVYVSLMYIACMIVGLALALYVFGRK